MSYGLRQAYEQLAKLGDPLAGVNVNDLLDWERFRPIAEELYNNKTERGGHPNIDCVLMIKILVLQHWYSLSDQRMERELASNISFINFLGFPETIPDSSTIWIFRERLKEKDKINALWQELQRQLDSKGLVVKEGKVLSRMRRSSQLTQGAPEISLEAMRLGLAVVRTVRGLRKEKRSILVISFTAMWMSNSG